MMNNDTYNALLRDKNILKSSVGDYVVYNRKWLLKHLDEEYETLKMVRDSKECKPFSREEFERWMKEGKINGQD